MWFIGGDTAPAATATGIEDDDRYGLDLANGGVGRLTFRAQAGSHFGRIDGTGVAFGGTFSHTGSASFTGSVTVGTGFVVITGASIFGGTASVASTFQAAATATFSAHVTMASTLNVAGAATAGSLRSAGAATMASTLNVLSTFDATGVATFRSGVTMASTLLVSGVATFVTAVTMATTLLVSGVATFVSTVTGSSFYASVAGGTPPFSSNSTTVCTNLSADMLDGLHATDLVTNASYVGNGSGSRLISLGWRPLGVLITTQGLNATFPQMGMLLDVNQNTAIVTSRTGTTSATAVVVASELARLTTPGFIVDAAGINPFGNTSGVTYYYTAWRTS